MFSLVPRLSGPAPEYPVRIEYTVSGDSQYPVDHDAQSGVLLMSGESGPSINVKVVRDTQAEALESFILDPLSLAHAVAGPNAVVELVLSDEVAPAGLRLISSVLGSEKRRTVFFRGAGSGQIKAVSEGSGEPIADVVWQDPDGLADSIKGPCAEL